MGLFKGGWAESNLIPHNYNGRKQGSDEVGFGAGQATLGKCGLCENRCKWATEWEEMDGGPSHTRCYRRFSVSLSGTGRPQNETATTFRISHSSAMKPSCKILVHMSLFIYLLVLPAFIPPFLPPVEAQNGSHFLKKDSIHKTIKYIIKPQF